MSDYDRQQWQAEQTAQDAALTAHRDKMAKARERSARNAQRKISRLHAKLTELGHISDFEDEFGESVLERLDKYGSAFHDPEKGRAGDALSAAQKQVVSRMNKKLKELKAKSKAESDESEGGEDDSHEDEAYSRTVSGWQSKPKKASASQNKNQVKGGFGRNHYQPRVRHIEDDLPDAPDIDFSDPKIEPFSPKHAPEAFERVDPPKPTGAKRPFLRLVRSHEA